MAIRRRLTEKHPLVKFLNELDDLLTEHKVEITWGDGGNCLVFSQHGTHAVHSVEGDNSISLPITYDGVYFISDEYGNILDYEEE